MERRIILPGTGNYIEIIQASLKLIFQFSSIYIQNIIFSRLALKRFLFFSRAFLPIKRANRRYDSLEFLLSSSKLVYICFLGLKVLPILALSGSAYVHNGTLGTRPFLCDVLPSSFAFSSSPTTVTRVFP